MAINMFFLGGWGEISAKGARAPARTLLLARSHAHPKIYTKIYSYFFRGPPPLPVPLLLSFPSPPHSFSCFSEPSYICRQVNKVSCPCDPRNQWRGCLGFPDKEIIKRGEGRRRGGCVYVGGGETCTQLFSLSHCKPTFNLAIELKLDISTKLV